MKQIKNQLDELLVNVGDMALKRRAQKVIVDLNLKSGDKILDLGCGNGYYSFLLSKLPLRIKISGVDNHLNAIEDAKKVVGTDRAKFIIGNAEKLPFPNKSFTKIVMSEIIEHVEDDLAVLREVRRVLKPGGVLVLTTPNKYYPFFWDPVNWVLERFFNYHIKSGFFAGIWNQHLKLYGPEEIKKRVEEAGFKMVSCTLLTSWCLPFNHYLLNLGARLLYSKQLSINLLQDINKFNQSRQKKTFLANGLFWLVNTYDKLNDMFPNSSGVSILITAF